MSRCWGDRLTEDMREYHDHVWGKPENDDVKLFKMLSMECFQAGLSWAIVLKREKALETAFDGFDPRKVAAYDDAKVDQMLTADGMIRHRGKIEAVIHNARCYQAIQREFGSFDAYIWGYTEGKVIDSRFTDSAELPAKTELSERIARDMRKRGFKFLGATTVYAFLQSIGVVNDHLVGCDWR